MEAERSHDAAFAQTPVQVEANVTKGSGKRFQKLKARR